MPRPPKCRRVCCLPTTNEFIPAGSSVSSDSVVLTVDEYETIRLIDKEGLSQEECGEYMKVARTTVQQMYTSARHKIALAIVDGRRLKIHGGHYELCQHKEGFCCGACCRRRQELKKQEEMPL